MAVKVDFVVTTSETSEWTCEMPRWVKALATRHEGGEIGFTIHLLKTNMI